MTLFSMKQRAAAGLVLLLLAATGPASAADLCSAPKTAADCKAKKGCAWDSGLCKKAVKKTKIGKKIKAKVAPTPMPQAAPAPLPVQPKVEPTPLPKMDSAMPEGGDPEGKMPEGADKAETNDNF